jgi:NosR/NirI family transcriptional regulator, nitrite reductase regulator
MRLNAAVSRAWGACCLLLVALGAGPATSADVDRETAAALLGVSAEAIVIMPSEGTPPAQRVDRDGQTIGYLASTWDVVRSTGYSGRPIDILVAVDPAGKILGTRLLTQNEPILTIGISPKQLEDYVSTFVGIDAGKSVAEIAVASKSTVDGITGATLSSSVIRNGIIRTARTVTLSRAAPATDVRGIDTTSFAPATWAELVSEGAIAHRLIAAAEVAALLPARSAAPDGVFIDLYATLATPAAIGRNLLDQREYDNLIASMNAGDSSILIAARGLYSFKGTSWRKSGRFDRLQVVQGPRTFGLTTTGYRNVERLAPADAPEFREIGLFVLPAAGGFDPAQPWRLSLLVERDGETGPVSAAFDLSYRLPDRLLLAPSGPTVSAAPVEVPLWQEIWRGRMTSIAFVVCLLLTLYLILIFQDALVRRYRLYRAVRLGFLTITLIGLGWVVGAQLSVVHILTFVDALLAGFRWEQFLLDPLVFIIWGWLAVALLFWGRGVFCGWLCPFGALQELLNEAARKIGIRQVVVPFGLHERLWPLKYILFLGLLAISLNSMTAAFVGAEIEPFKTAITLMFVREWPFVAFAASLLFLGLFIERFYCRYLCPLGAALAIPARLRMFDWLKRRYQCGRECRICASQCPVQAIHPDGHINPNECIHCLNCQTLYYDPAVCPPLKVRARRRSGEGSASKEVAANV